MDGSSGRMGGGWGLFFIWECLWALYGSMGEAICVSTATGIAYHGMDVFRWEEIKINIMA